MKKADNTPALEPITLAVQSVEDGLPLEFTDVSETGFKVRVEPYWVLYLKAPKGCTIVFKGLRPDSEENLVGKTIVKPEGFEGAVSVPRAAEFQLLGHAEVQVISGQVFAAQFGGFNASER
jgi:hypothetical protein